MTLGEKLRAMRKYNAKTLQDMSKDIHISMNTIYRWENDLTRPRKTSFDILSNYFGVTVDNFLTANAEASIVTETEQELLTRFRKLEANNQFRVLGYVERMGGEAS